MKTNQTNKSLVAVAVLGAFLSACSGGGENEATSTKLPTKTNTTTTTNPFTTTPTVGSGPISVGMTGNETIDDVKAQNDEIMNKLDAISGQVNEANENASDAASNSNWAKWLGVGIASAIGLSMLYNGVRNGMAKGSVMDGVKGFFFNEDNDADEVEAQARHASTVQQTSAAAAYTGGITAAAAAQAAKDSGKATIDVVKTVPDATAAKVEAKLTPKIDAATGAANGAASNAADAAHNSSEALAVSQRMENMLKTDLQVAKEQLTAAQSTISEVRASDANKQGQIDAMKKEISDKRAEIERLENAIKANAGAAQENQAQIKSLRDEAVALNARVDALSKEKLEVVVQNTVLQQDASNADQVAGLLRDLTATASQANFKPYPKWSEDLSKARGLVNSMPEGQAKAKAGEDLQNLLKVSGS